MTARPDWKPTRYRATPAERRRILRAKVYGKPCRGCGAHGGPVPMNGHHLLAGIHREDLEELIVPLGGSGSWGCHGIYTSRHGGKDCQGNHRSWANVASRIRDTLTPEEETAIVGRVGDLGLERLYPRREPRQERSQPC